MTKPLAAAPNMEQLKKQAKDLQKAHASGDAEALSRIREFHPEFSEFSPHDILKSRFTLVDAQLTLAREYGFLSWPRLKKHVDSLTLAGQLKTAISANDVALVKQMIGDDRSLLDAPIGYGDAGPLTWAAECREPSGPPSAERLEIVRFLIEAGADIHKSGDAPLMRAALRDDRIPMMELLLANGADVNAHWNGEYPIILAPCEAVAPAALQWLLDRGADPNPRYESEPNNGSPLDMAIATYARHPRQSECVNILKAAGGGGKYSDVPSMSIHRGRLDLLAAEIDADPDLVHKRFPELDYGQSGARGLTLTGGSLLHVAAEYRELEVARLLIDRGANVNLPALVDDHGVGGQTPIFHAVTQFRDFGLAVVELLIDHGADLTVRARVPSAYDKPGEFLDVTPLGYAARFPLVEWECHETTDLLQKHGAPAGDVYAAARLGLVDELRSLLSAGGDPNSASPYGDPAIVAAKSKGHHEIVEILRAAGAIEA